MDRLQAGSTKTVRCWRDRERERERQREKERERETVRETKHEMEIKGRARTLWRRCSLKVRSLIHLTSVKHDDQTMGIAQSTR